MALQDILAAITALADERIASARKAHQRDLSDMREENERSIASKKQEIAMQKEEKKTQMANKAKTHAAMLIRNAELKKKRLLLDALYDQVSEALAALPPEKVESLLKACLRKISQKGTLHCSAKHADLLKKIADSSKFTFGDTISASGGFMFISEKEEHDFTFEHLVSAYLRPDTEVDIAQSLFA